MQLTSKFLLIEIATYLFLSIFSNKVIISVLTKHATCILDKITINVLTKHATCILDKITKNVLTKHACIKVSIDRDNNLFNLINFLKKINYIIHYIIKVRSRGCTM